MNLSKLEIGPILRALMRNKVGAVLIAIQIAVTMTVIVNAIFIIIERSKLMDRDSGIDQANSFYLTSTGFANDFNPKVTVTEDLEALRQTPGVINAVQINAIPISGSGWSMSLQTEAGEGREGPSTAVYMVDEHGLQTLDLTLLAGENFTPSEIRWRERNDPDWPASVIITQTLAGKLYPEQGWRYALGKTIYIDENQPMQVKGIVDKLHAPWINWDEVENAMLSPERMLFSSTRYLIRTEAGMRDTLMPQIEEMLAERNKGRIIRSMHTVEETWERSYRRHGAMIKILSTVMIILTLITALGIIGLASFTVNRRKKQIGTRRALGASQAAIVRYFMLENFLVSTVGVLLGAGMTIGLNLLLVNTFALTPIDGIYIPIGMLVLWLVGQLAVLGPAKKAANIPPALATRSV